MTAIGYGRVSTNEQDTELQKRRLQEAGCTTVRCEKVSGKSREGRDELASILDFIRPGDLLVVTKLDRLGRSTRDVLNIVHELEQRGAALRVLEPAIDTAGPMGKMVLTVLGMVAEMELGFIRARQLEGIAKAKSAGVYRGRKPVISASEIRRLRDEESLGPSAIAKRLRISRMSVHRAFKAA